MRDQILVVRWGMFAMLITPLFFLIRQIISIYKRVYMDFNANGLVFNGLKVVFDDLLSVSRYYVKVIKPRYNRYSRTFWHEEYYYRCCNLRFKFKDILIGYLFEESSMGLNEIIDPTEIQDKMKGHCEIYRGNEPYIYIFSEDDFRSIYSNIVKRGIKVETIR